VQGILIGPGLDGKFVNARRAILDHWFDIETTRQKEKIFDGASLLIQTNPSLWKQLPPAANEFMEKLQIWK